jgi:hypothetical protein
VDNVGVWVALLKKKCQPQGGDTEYHVLVLAGVTSRGRAVDVPLWGAEGLFMVA